MLECGCRLLKLRLALPHRRTHTLTLATPDEDADDDKDRDLQRFRDWLRMRIMYIEGININIRILTRII